MLQVEVIIVEVIVKLKQILHLKVGCSDFGPVRDRGSLPYIQQLELLNLNYLIALMLMCWCLSV